MIDETKKLVEALREDAEWAHANEWETPITLGDHLVEAADLIEKLSAQLVNQATEYSRALKITMEQRDAAVADMMLAEVDGFCRICAHLGCNDKAVCTQARDEYACFEWRGVKKQ